MQHKIIPRHAWSQGLPSPFTGVERTRNDVKSEYRNEQTNVSLYAPTLKAALALLDARSGGEKAAIGKQGKFMLAERVNTAGKIEAAVYNTVTGVVLASIFSDKESAPEPYNLKQGGKDGTILLLAIMAAHGIDNKEFETALGSISGHVNGSSTLDEHGLSQAGALLCDNIYARVVSAETLGDAGIKVSIPSTSNIRPISALNIKNGTYAPDEVLGGVFQVLKAKDVQNAANVTVNQHDLPGKFKFSEREFTPDEQFLIPAIAPWYVVSQEVVRICQHAKGTTGTGQPMRNFMLRGPAGVGKTEAAKAVAAALNLPYMSLTCSANTEIFDLLGQILPDVDGLDADPAKVAQQSTFAALPTLQDIQMDTSTAYFKLTGIYDENVTETDVYNKLLETARRQAGHSTENSQRFRYIETALVKAMKYGYLLEIQEPSVIANPGVLVGLNSLLDGCNQITLPTGETIYRHPDTVVVVTTNTEYSGCRDINQSVISRMNMVMDIEEPAEDEYVKRVAAVTGFADTYSLQLMVSVVKDIQRHSRQTMITDGCCGMRELTAWVQSFMITGDMLESAKYTVLSSVSADAENRQDILSTCIEPKIA